MTENICELWDMKVNYFPFMTVKFIVVVTISILNLHNVTILLRCILHIDYIMSL